MTNPNSVRRDAIFKGEEGDWNWDGIWSVASALTDFGWSAEFSIPFKTLSFSENADWGLNLVREIVRNKEQIGWSSRNRSTGPAVAGVLTGIRGVSQGVGLDIVPSVSVQSINDRVDDEDHTNTEPSLDVYYKITPSLNASLTLNTDFSATEVDNRQVDLTRFSQFFPEKRSFFLSESEIFEFGGIGGGGGGRGGGGNSALSNSDRENARPFFSRRIGLSDEGEQVGLDGGIKVTGRAGIWNVGILGIVQEEYEVQAESVDPEGVEVVDATNIFVGRLAANVLAESTAGFIFTSGDPRSNLDNQLFGIDFNYRNSRLSGGKRLDADIWYQQSDTEDESGDDAAFGITVNYPSQTGLRGGLSFVEIQDKFNPALGFVSRSDIRRVASDVAYTHRYTDRYIDNIVLGVDFQRVNLIDGELQSQNLVLRPLEIQNWIGDELQISHRIQKENLQEDFEIEDGVFIPAGEYEFADTEISIRTSNARSVDFELELRSGDFYTGTIKSAEVEFAWRPSKHFLASLSYGVDFADLPEGEFDRRVTSANLTTVFSNELSWVNLIQFDNESNDLGIDSRLHWAPEAGRNLYFVLSHNMHRDEVGDRFRSTQTGLTLKLGHTFRF
jgi:hypothetical protein